MSLDDSGDDGTGFLLLISELGKQGGDPNIGALVPGTDVEDMIRGARYVPGEVTEARRRGETVEFITGGSQWHWVMPDGSLIPHET